MHTMTTSAPALCDALDRKPDPTKTAQACRKLIDAYVSDSGDVREALRLALEAFGLPHDYIETEGGRWH